MNDDENLDEERQRLFAMVWQRPATEVAKELGISDVALSKRCRRLQVPKPPRGYWARIATGKTPRRPPLPAYRAEIAERLRREVRSSSQVRLSKLQLEFLGYALEELKTAGQDTKACKIGGDGIRAISPTLAAQVLIILQNRYERWLSDRTTAQRVNAALSSLKNLVEKLQPHAKEQVIVFHRKSDDSYSRSSGPSILVRATLDFLTRLAQMSGLARTHGLAYVTADMSALDHAWSVNQIASPRSRSRAKTELCVSSHSVWIRALIEDSWSRDRFETVRLPLRDVCPIELMPAKEARIPSKIRRSGIKPYADRLQALCEGQTIYDGLVNATYDMDRALPDERLALFDRLWSGSSESGPLMAARRAWRSMEADLDRWEQELEAENLALCEDVLGIRVGDILVVEARGKLVRVEVEGMSVYSSGPEVTFGIWGTRFRKDGLPGKRTEQFWIAVENDLESEQKSLDR